MTFSQDAVSKKIRSWMLENEKSLKWLADQIDVSKSLVGHMLNGARKWQEEQLIVVAKIMGMPLSQLLDMKDSSPSQPAYTVRLRGNVETRIAKRHLDELLFAVEDCEKIEALLATAQQTVTHDK